MRAREILEENYNQNLESDLNNVLVSVKALGKSEIDTKDVVSYLYSMGYSVDENSISGLLTNNPLVLNVTPDMIKLSASENNIDNDAEDSALKVSNMAKKAVDIG